MTYEAQSIVNILKSIANAKDLMEIDKVQAVIFIFKGAEWKDIEEAYDKILEIILSMENNKGSARGILYGNLLKKKINAEHSDLKGEAHSEYIENIIQSILSKTEIRPSGKIWAINDSLVEESDIVISNTEFYKICQIIIGTDDKVLDWKLKEDALKRVGMKVIKGQSKIAEIIQGIADVESSWQSSIIKYDLGIGLWQGSENNPDKASQLAQVYNSLINIEYAKGRQEKKTLVSLMKPFDSKFIVENVDMLLAQINSIECENSFKQAAYATLFLSVDNTPENTGALLKLCGEIKRIQQLDKAKENGGAGDNQEKYDTTTIDSLMNSIVYQELADINIIDNWENKTDIQKKNIIHSIESLLQGNDSKYAEDGYIFRFIQLCKHEFLKVDEKDTNHFITLYQTYLSGIDNTNSLDVYEKQINENGTIDSDNIHDFETQVMKYRSKGARLPKAVYNYIIKEALHGRMDRVEQALLIQSAIIDFTYDILDCIGESNYFVFFKGNMITTFGTQSKSRNSIFYNVDTFNPNHRMYTFKLAELNSTAYHESRHRWQDFARTKGYLNKRAYKMSQENAIQKCNSFFYKAHYGEMEEEIDARIFESIMSTQFLLEAGFSSEEISDQLLSTLDAEIKKDKKYNRGEKTNFDGKVMTTSELLQQGFDSNPKKKYIDKIFEENPLLSLEYRIVYSDEDESMCKVERRSKEEIEYIYQKLLAQISDERDRKNVNELFDYIINGERESTHSEFTTGEYLQYYGYDASWSVEELSRMSPCLCDYQIFVGKVNNDLKEPFPGIGTQPDVFGRPEV